MSNRYDQTEEERERVKRFAREFCAIKTTLCWQCNKEFSMRAPACPHCGATNANVDFEKANKEAI